MFIFGLIMIMISGYFNLSFAEESIESFRPGVIVKKESRKECMEKFNVNNIDLIKNAKVGKYRLGADYLLNYFTCKAAAENNITVCNRLKQFPGFFKMCKSAFNQYFAAYGALATTGHIGPRVLSAFAESTRMSTTGAKLFSRAWLDDDLSFCDRFSNKDKRNGCKALLSGNAKLCPRDDKECRYVAYYIKALKSGDVRQCDKIKGDDKFGRLKLICQVVVSGDSSVCEKDKNFIKFRDRYCQ